MMDGEHHPQGAASAQAALFANCFNPDDYLLDKHFGWMPEERREELGERAMAHLKEAYIETLNEMHGAN